MIKGHVCIDLHNHKSGFTERVEGDNIVTKAFDTELNRLMYSGIPSFDRIMPLYKTILGGLCILDTPLDDSGSGEIFVPSVAKIVGFGFQGSNADSILGGTYNSNESGLNADQNIYTHVWDFSTSQANGQIRSLGLTNSIAAKAMFIPIVTTPENNDRLIYFDRINSKLYVWRDNSEDRYKVYVRNTNLINLDFHVNGRGSGNGRNNNDKYMGFSIPTDLSGNKIIKISGGRVYFCSISGSRTLSLKEYVLQQSGLSYEYIKEINFPKTINLNTLCGTFESVSVIYVASYDRMTLYKIDVSNDYAVTPYDISFSGADNEAVFMCCLPNGDVYISKKGGGSSNRTGIRFSYARGEVDKMDYLTNDPTIDALFNLIGESYQVYEDGICIGINTYIAYLANVLMTNYNLPAMVEKTANTSMKITYTLSEV